MSPEELFWALAEELKEDPFITEGTMMGHRCLRADGQFLAMLSKPDATLIVKLPAPRVIEEIATGGGRSFAPAGKVFTEWLEVPIVDEGHWRSLLEASKSFVTGRG